MDVKAADRIRHCQTSSADTNSEPLVDIPPMALLDKEQLTHEWTETASTCIIPPPHRDLHKTSMGSGRQHEDRGFFQENGEVPQEDEN